MSRERRDSLFPLDSQEEILSSGEEWAENREQRREERRQQFVSSVQPSTSRQQEHHEVDSEEDDDEGTAASQSRRFTEEENDVLVGRVLQHYETLKGANAQKTSHKQKSKIWSQIASEVSACGVRARTVEVCQKRFRDCKRTTKAKMATVARHARGRGGGKPLRIKFKPWVEKMRQILRADLVEGTVDTLEPPTFQPQEDTARPRRDAKEAGPGTRRSKSGDLGSSRGQSSGEDVRSQLESQVAVEVAGTSSYTEQERRSTKSTVPAKSLELRKKAHKRRRVTEEDVSEHVVDVHQESITSESVVTQLTTYQLPDAMEEIASVVSETEPIERDSDSLSFSPAETLVHEDAATSFEMLQEAFPNLQVPATAGEGPSQARVPSTGTSLPPQLVHGLLEESTRFASITNFARQMGGRQETTPQNMEDRVQRIGDSVDRLSYVVEDVRSSYNSTNSLLEQMVAVQEDIAASLRLNNTIQERMALLMEQNTALYFQMNQSMAQMDVQQQQQTMHLQLMTTHLQNLSEELRVRRAFVIRPEKSEKTEDI
ncbi:uncharacterized protein LOC142100968 isoform X2 [Mixophyes fleayi]|uniref:uncharacterized protein LOC142100968 isoform X2 n=1 Tax=Mixophyes fleayi TaxID=3061075 RepID=UPI003F4E197E